MADVLTPEQRRKCMSRIVVGIQNLLSEMRT